MRDFRKSALRGATAAAVMGALMCGMVPTAAAEEETGAFSVQASKLLPTVIANDSSQTIVKLLVRDRDSDCDFINNSVFDWRQIEENSAYDSRRPIVRNLASGYWAQYNISEEKDIARIGDAGSQRLIDVQATLADGRVLELDKIDVCTKDIILTDAGLETVSIAKKASATPAIVQDGSKYFRTQQPKGYQAAESVKAVSQQVLWGTGNE